MGTGRTGWTRGNEEGSRQGQKGREKGAGRKKEEEDRGTAQTRTGSEETRTRGSRKDRSTEQTHGKQDPERAAEPGSKGVTAGGGPKRANQAAGARAWMAGEGEQRDGKNGEGGGRGDGAEDAKTGPEKGGEEGPGEEGQAMRPRGDGGGGTGSEAKGSAPRRKSGGPRTRGRRPRTGAGGGRRIKARKRRDNEQRRKKPAGAGDVRA